MKNKLKNPFKILSQQKGIALLVALVAVMLVSYIALEVGQESMVEYLVSSNEVNRVKAYYAAKAGVQISILRVFIYQQAQAQFGKDAPQTLLDQIWQMPFSWPVRLPKDSLEMDKDTFEQAAADSLMGEQEYLATISSEGGKIDLNDLDSPSKALAESTKNQLLQIIATRLDGDDDWARENTDIKPEDVVNNIIDWVSPTEESVSGGGKRNYYRDLPSDAGDNIPPGAPFKTLEELHVVAGVTPQIYELLSPKVTIYGVKGIQVNHAAADVLKSLDTQINDDIVKEIMERRSDPLVGPFKDEKEFYEFLGSRIPDVEKLKEKKIPLLFDSEFSFLITSTGLSGRATREIIALVYDFDRVKDRLTKIVAAERATPTPTPGTVGPTPTPTPGGTPTPTPGASSKTSQPRIVYWLEN